MGANQSPEGKKALSLQSEKEIETKTLMCSLATDGLVPWTARRDMIYNTGAVWSSPKAGIKQLSWVDEWELDL